jgi:two-component system LytT family response regulator
MVGMIEPSALPQIVFVTAYDEHALKAFEEHAADYLLKPIDPQRLSRTLDWLRAGGRPTATAATVFPGADSPLRQIPCIMRNRIVLIALPDVEYVCSGTCGVEVCGIERQGITELTLKILQQRTPLVRCHRQYLVNLERVGEIELLDNGAAEIVMRSGKRVPVSRRHLREIKERLLIG